jgi:uncharacterized membrane protein YqgA involved in biofilm formation
MTIHGLGTLINISTIVVGTFVGIISGERFKPEIRELLTQTLGYVTIIAGVDTLRSFWDSALSAAFPKDTLFLTLLFSLVLGTLLGYFLKIEDHLFNFGEKVKSKFKVSGNHRFTEGFVTASLLFVIGPMAILGSISDGMGNGISQLVLKSILDGITSIAFAAAMGSGVALSALPVGIYQGAWTLIGFYLGSALPHYQILAMNSVGGLLLVGIGLRLTKIKEVPVATMMPSLFLIIPISYLFHLLK